MQHGNQPKPFLLEINGLKPLKFGVDEPEPPGVEAQPDEEPEKLDKLEFLDREDGPQAAGIVPLSLERGAIDNASSGPHLEPVQEVALEPSEVVNASYPATDDLWSWRAVNVDPVLDGEIELEVDLP